MSSQLILLSLIFLSLLTPIFSDEVSVMNDLLSSITKPPDGWSKTTHFCTWNGGINCDSTNKHVIAINLNSLSLYGTLPSNLNTLSQLKTLTLQKNRFYGTIPSLSNLTLLQEVYLDTNNFTDVAPDLFYGLPSLQSVSIGDNLQLKSWVIPSELSESSSLVTFYADSANLIGSIPDFIGELSNLQNLRLSYNNLTGVLPLSFTGSELRNLWLNNQAVGLSGTIDVLGRMTQLSQVWLQKNAFTGPVPDLSNCTHLFDLQLRENQFTGVLPDSLSALPSLKNITLQNNKLQGPLPVFGKDVIFEPGTTNSFCKTTPGPCDSQVTILLEIVSALGYPLTLAESWQGNDACQSWTFISCDAQQKNVTIVNFAKQKFSGTISPAFAKLTSLKSLYLNDNNLTGSIPDSLSTLSQLTALDVSNNNLSGPVPTYSSAVKFTSKGNPLLGTNPGTISPGPDGKNTTSPDDKSPGSSSKSSKIHIGIIIAIVVCVILFVGIVLFVLWKFCYRRHHKFGSIENPEISKDDSSKNGGMIAMNGYNAVPSELQSQSSDHSEFHGFEGGNVVIPIHVLRQVTNNFSEDNILGRGGFGIVYKGELQDGTKIAVKRMESSGMGSKGLNEFQAEIAVLTKVRHRHLVALLSYCINGNERLLVYEYMPQGTLSQHLFGRSDDDDEGPVLTWKQRVTIGLDVARGIEYLHSLARESFIHRDLKPSNILLGDDMRAKVADFGLVKNAPDGKYSMETRLAGTFGYLAPEYAATGRVTTKVDVYAFGVVLMELITGRKSLDENMPDERSHLVSWFRRVLVNKENLPKAIDQTLNPDEATLESICKVAELAGHCTAREPSQRPDMGHAVNVLGPLVEIWKPSCREEDENDGIDLHLSLPQALQRWQANEGTSTMTRGFYDTQTQSSIPPMQDSFNSSNCR